MSEATKLTGVERGLLLGGAIGALGTLVPVALHQFGVLDHLPDPPGAVFDSDGITESKTAHPFGVPDSVPGIGSYAATLTLVLLARRSSGARSLLATKLVLDGSAAGFNVVRQVVQFGKICSWCTGTALCTAVMLVGGRRLLVREGRRGWNEVQRLAEEA